LLPNRIGASNPWPVNQSFLDLLFSLDLAPEFAIIGPHLDCLDRTEVARVREILVQKQLRPTVHAPFFDLNVGALDPVVRGITYQRLSQALEFAGGINAKLMVVHPGFDCWRYPGLDTRWTQLAVEFFPALLEQAEQYDCRLALENIYEASPNTLVDVVNKVDSPWLGHCFDVGHWQLFNVEYGMADWLQTIQPKLFHMHLHDNLGCDDDHLPIGEGAINFTPLIDLLSSLPTAPSITLEAHKPEHLQRSLKNLRETFL